MSVQNENGNPASRRSLLKLIGTTAGSAMMYETMVAMGYAGTSDFNNPIKLSGDVKGATVLVLGAGLAGTALGGLLVRWARGWRAVWMAVALESAVLAALAAGAASLPLAGLTALVGLLFGAMACGFVAIYSALMGLASPSQPGVDFALFQCADALIAMAGGVAGGWLAQRFGYGACFALAAVMAAAAAAFAARRHG